MKVYESTQRGEPPAVSPRSSVEMVGARAKDE